MDDGALDTRPGGDALAAGAGARSGGRRRSRHSALRGRPRGGRRRAFGRPSCCGVVTRAVCIYSMRREQTSDERATERGAGGAGETEPPSLRAPAARASPQGLGFCAWEGGAVYAGWNAGHSARVTRAAVQVLRRETARCARRSRTQWAIYCGSARRRARGRREGVPAARPSTRAALSQRLTAGTPSRLAPPNSAPLQAKGSTGAPPRSIAHRPAEAPRRAGGAERAALSRPRHPPPVPSRAPR